jgi:hypothetical protein
MPDISTIATFLGSLKTATELAKSIKGANLSLEKAETKLEMAELISALADARIQAAEIQELLIEKENKIAGLKKAFELKSQLIRHGDAYYEISETREPKGDPFCSHCWEVNFTTIHLHYGLQGRKICPFCHNSYKEQHAPSL